MVDKKIAVIDADLIGRKKHRFPNLACMKISGYYKELGYNVELKTDYDNLECYYKVFISKVFTDTPIDEKILNLNNVEYGGTGFYYDKSPKLIDEIEHHMPDYHLYDNWINLKLSEIDIKTGKNKYKRNDFKYYLDYSIGFMTRGCFRQCEFCVNKNYKIVLPHSPLEEFYDSDRKKICLLDDNFLGCSDWKEMLKILQDTKKPFQFKQGLDERLLTPEKCEKLFSCRYDGDYIFAFDNIADAPIIENKLKLIREYTNIIPKFYVFCGFDRNNNWDLNFWKQDLWDLFKRIEILIKYRCIPYIMRFNRYEDSPYRGIYVSVANWCNLPSMFKKKSFREFCEYKNNRRKNEVSDMRYLKQIENEFPELAKMYFDLKWK